MKSLRSYLLSAILLSCLLPSEVCARTYTLQQCQDSALQNNISVRQQRNNYELQRITYTQNKQNLLPSVSGYAAENFSFGRATGVDNITRAQNMANTSFSLSANLLLFDGLGMKYRIDEARANMEASKAQTEAAEIDIRMNITTMFLQALLRKELLLVADTQLLSTRLKLDRQEQLVAEGRVAEGELYTLRAQYASEELSRIQAQNDHLLALLDLAQAMNVAFDEQFDIVSNTLEAEQLLNPDMPVSADEVYEQALLHRPEMRAAQAQLSAQQSALKNAKAAYSPTLSAGANFGTGYYHNFGADNTNFGTQLGNNLSGGVSLNLNIPIFDRMQTPNNINRQKININNTQLQIEQTKQNLRKQIDQAYYNALAAQAQQRSAEKAMLSAAEAFRYAEQKFEAGRSSAYEYYEAKNTYVKAQSDYLQAKYNYLFKVEILKYYKGEK